MPRSSEWGIFFSQKITIYIKQFNSILVNVYQIIGGQIMQWYLNVLKNYVNFNGRARRKEYWMFTLITVIITIILSIVELILGFEEAVITALYSLAVMLPTLAVTIRRLHDTGRSGWWFLISLIPLIGAIVILVFTVQDSQVDENKYGPNPKL
jgi:uncharacterized membrane protein YhaH (DUF805 family)